MELGRRALAVEYGRDAALQIRGLAQQARHRVGDAAGARGGHELLHGVQAAADRRGVHEGLGDPLPQEAAAKGGHRPVHDPHEGAVAAAVGEVLEQLQVAHGGRAEVEVGRFAGEIGGGYPGDG